MDAFETVQDLLSRGETVEEQIEVCADMVNAACDCLGIETVLGQVRDYANSQINLSKVYNDGDSYRTWSRIVEIISVAQKQTVRQLHPGG